MTAQKITFSVTGAACRLPAGRRLAGGAGRTGAGAKPDQPDRAAQRGEHARGAGRGRSLPRPARSRDCRRSVRLQTAAASAAKKSARLTESTYINDSKATNIDALEKALIAMRTPVVLLAGGKDKGLDFSGMRPLLREKVKGVVLIGQMTEKLFAAWSSAVPCVAGRDAGGRRRAAPAARAARRRRPLFARLLELRHVQGLRGPRQPVPRAGPGPRAITAT